MKPVVRNSLADDAIHRWGVDLSTEGGRLARATIVDHHDQNVRSIFRKSARRHPLAVHRLLHSAAGNTGRRCRRKRKRLLFFHAVPSHLSVRAQRDPVATLVREPGAALVDDDPRPFLVRRRESEMVPEASCAALPLGVLPPSICATAPPRPMVGIVPSLRHLKGLGSLSSSHRAMRLRTCSA